jgi:hypothetical protein
MTTNKIKIDGTEYDYDALTDAAKQQLQSLHFVDSELMRLESTLAVLKTARVAYAKALNQALQSPATLLAQQLAGDTIKLG